MKIHRFTEIGANVVLGLVGSIVLKEIAKNYSLIDTANSLQSITSLAVGVTGYVMGSMVSQFLINKIKDKPMEEDSNNQTNVKHFKDWHWIHEPKNLHDVLTDESFGGISEKSNVIPVTFKKSKIK